MLCEGYNLVVESRNRNALIIFILGTLTTIGPFSIDMYLAAFPKIAEDFETTTSKIALSLSSYFVGLAIGQIFYGPLLDRFGRKRPIYFGLTLYIVASIGCALTQSADQLIGMRLFQALGGCSASVAAIAMVRDFFSPQEGARVFSKLMLILSVSPLFAPTFGGWVTAYWSWQLVFWILAAIVLVILLAVAFFLPEGYQPDSSVSLNPKDIFATYAEIVKNRQFATFSITGAFSFAGLFTYLSGAPGIFMGMYHLSENTFGLIFAGLSVGMIGGGQLNLFLMRWYSSYQIFKTVVILQLIMGIVVAVGTGFDLLNLYGHIVVFFLYISCVGLTYPNAASLSMAPFTRNAGSASAVLGTLQMAVGALASALFGTLAFEPNFAVGIVFVLAAIIGNTIFWFSKRHPEHYTPA